MDKKAFAHIILGILGLGTAALAQPPGSPGIGHTWAPALKQAVGTAYERQGAQSPVWFTVAEGILTEVFYPRVDSPQIGDLQFLVSDGVAFFSEQRRDVVSEVTTAPEGMSVLIRGHDKSGKYELTQEIITDPIAPVVRIRAQFRWKVPGLKLFVLFKPALQNEGAGNLGFAHENALSAFRTSGETAVALTSKRPFVSTSAGFSGVSDGWQDIKRNLRITVPDREAGPGNIALTGELEVPNQSTFTVELALGFSATPEAALATAQASLQEGFETLKVQYNAGWHRYLTSVEPRAFLTQSAQARQSLQIIKMHEDKRTRGAIVASLSKPAIPGGERASDRSSPGDGGGYHLVWPRDLYHAAMGLLAGGDRDTARAVLTYLAGTQNLDGSWAQNFWVDGRPYWQGLQMDEVALPILLAAKFVEQTGESLSRPQMQMIQRAAGFIADHGPKTPQDRWEEVGGFVPHTLAAQIAALRAAAQILKDSAFSRLAEQWDAKLESWTFVREGLLGGAYYLRTSPSGTPEINEPVGIANGGGMIGTQEMLDGGFLDLVRLGVRDPKDPRILSTLAFYEDPSHGVAGDRGQFRRYTRDAYGPKQKGGYWPLLAGERGHTAVAQGDFERALKQLQALESSALTSGVIPEQGGTAKGVACPLVWAHAEDVRLHWSLSERRVFDTPARSPVSNATQ